MLLTQCTGTTLRCDYDRCRAGGCVFLSETEGYRKIRKHREAEQPNLYFTGDVIKVIKQRDIQDIIKQRDIQDKY